MGRVQAGCLDASPVSLPPGENALVVEPCWQHGVNTQVAGTWRAQWALDNSSFLTLLPPGPHMGPC